MKIGDFKQCGNVLRLYMVDDSCKDYWGDDWDDRPYEHNAGQIYDEYVVGVVDVGFPLSYRVETPADDWTFRGNSPFSKEDFKKRGTPFALIVPRSEDACTPDYLECLVRGEQVWALHFGDSLENIQECIADIGKVIYVSETP